MPIQKRKLEHSFTQAQALAREGKSDEAKKLMEQVVKEFPQTTVATEANKVLDGKQVESVLMGAVGELMGARMSANEGSAHASIRTIGSGQLLQRSTVGEFQSLEEMGRDGILDSVLASGIKSGYKFETIVGPDKKMHFTATGSSPSPARPDESIFSLMKRR